MRIILIGKKCIIKETLPKYINDNFWIIDKNKKDEKKIISIKYDGKKYELISNDYYKIIDKKYIKKNRNTITEDIYENIISNIVLEERQSYLIFSENTNELYILYCLPDYENTFSHYDIVNTDEITIGSDKNNIIVYNNPFVASIHAKITKFKDKWTIENYDRKYGLFVNDFPVYDNTKNIFNGDIIFIMGLEIVMIKNSIYINNPQENVNIDKIYFALSSIEKQKIDKKELELEENIEKTETFQTQYYTKSPREITQIKKEEISIDDPPQLTDERQRPALLVLGSSIAMGIVMLFSFSSTMQGIANGTVSKFEIFTRIFMIIALLIAMIVIPILDMKWEKKSKKKYEQRRQKRYKQYLKDKRDLINEIKNKQREKLYNKYPSADECTKIIMLNDHRLWERKIEDDDFLDIRVGIGKVPLKIELSYPEEKFTMVDDNLLVELKEFVENSKNIDYAPVTISLYKNKVSAIISKNDKITSKYIKNIILQLVTFHSYEDLRLVFFLNKKTSKEWQYVKMLPHVWDDAKQIRFFADDYDDMNEISKYLMEEMNERTEEKNEKNANFLPHYLIITDDYKKIETLNFITNILQIKDNIGYSIVCITDDIYSLPSECETFVDIKDEKNGIVYKKGIDLENKTEIKIEPLITVFFEKIVQKLANIPIRSKKKTTALPNNYTFLEMYNVENIDELDILGRWKKNDSTLSLKAPIGIDSNGMIISLDAHEKFHGPHGLIAGATGSGKSEFIITYILSLAINYNPNDVTFLLIDYKGGGLAGAFKKNNIKLPHLVGIITNIEQYGLKRSLISIQSELRRRQVIFNEARNLTNEGTIDIYKYQKLYHDGIVKEPISHLFIICDEFAELKQQQLDFMDELVSVSRIGRSLGVHLILATQKPSGIVDEQIRSNSKFGICLKVQNTTDSQDVILKPDAAYLKNPGQFYFKVGQNEYYTLGQSGWSGAPYILSDSHAPKGENTVEFISNIGLPIKRIEDIKQKNVINKGEQLTNILKYIYDLSIKQNMEAKQLWLEEIPLVIYVKDIRNKYNIKQENNKVKIIIGEFDDPYNQKQGPVELDLLKRENIIIYGNAESGKETLLSTLSYDIMTMYNTKQVQIYILDFGTEALKIFRNSPHVGDIIFIGENEKLETFFIMLQKTIKERKQILSDYNGDYNLYISKGNEMPIITIILNNYEGFIENYEDDYEDLFLTLTREASKCGIIFIVTASSTKSMRFRLTANFNKKIGLQLNDEDEYYSIFDNVKDKRPTHSFGRGLIEIDDDILEFQTAKICEDISYNEHIEETIEQLNEKNALKAVPVPTLPKKIELKDMERYLTDITKVPIGLIKKSLDAYIYDFTKKFTTVISSKNIDNAIVVTYYIIEEIKKLKNVNIIILDSEKVKDNGKKEADNFKTEVNKAIKRKDGTYTICVIIGISKLITNGAINEIEFDDFLKGAKERDNCSFIFTENPELLEKHTYKAWYTNFINQDSGMWIGHGVEKQTLIRTNFILNGLENNCDDSYGYIINGGDPIFIKFIGLEEESEE